MDSEPNAGAATDHEGAPAIALSMRLLLGGERGVGRPDEVVAAIADLLGVELAIDSIVRRRVVLSDDG